MTTKAKIDPETIPSTKPELGELIEEGVNVTTHYHLSQTTIKFLKSQSRYIENLQDLQHQESFVKFQATLRKIKIFVEKVTRLRVFETFFFAINIKKEFIESLKEYETYTLAKMIKDTKTSLYQEISHIKSKLEDTKDSIQQINPTLLKELSFSRRSDRR
ncbi:12812_t:CDS:2, partial [Gigaspora rosea]